MYYQRPDNNHLYVEYLSKQSAMYELYCSQR